MMFRAEIYWDTQDQANEGWAWRVRWKVLREESGEWGPGRLPDNPTEGQMEEAVVELAYENGIEITTGEVAVELKHDGGYAIYETFD